MEAKFKISEVDDLKGAISIGKPKPINKGPCEHNHSAMLKLIQI